MSQPNTPATACDVQGLLNENEGSCVKSRVAGLIPVEYEIHFDTPLRLPYAVNWNGTKQPPGRVALSKKDDKATIRIMARSGQTVGLYLGSDASPEHRKELLYPVTVGSNDMRIIIRSKSGRHDHRAEVSQQASDIQRNVHETGRTDLLDIYSGNYLTGDIWLRFSHKYTTAEALQMDQQAGETDAGLLAALRSLYGDVVNRSQGLMVDYANAHRCKLSFQSETDGNCVANIKTYADQGGFAGAALPRVHPRSWIALLQAARDSMVQEVEITSGWRPMTGKSPHRIGLGLDVKSVRNAQGRSVFDTASANASAEREDHQDWVDAQKNLLDADKELAAANAALKKATTDEGKTQAIKRQKEAKDTKDLAQVKHDKAKDSYMRKHGSTLAGQFEKALQINPLIRQLYDPFIMDDNTRDSVEPTANFVTPSTASATQVTTTKGAVVQAQNTNEFTHRNHLHVTAVDAYLLP